MLFCFQQLHCNKTIIDFHISCHNVLADWCVVVTSLQSSPVHQKNTHLSIIYYHLAAANHELSCSKSILVVLRSFMNYHNVKFLCNSVNYIR